MFTRRSQLIIPITFLLAASPAGGQVSLSFKGIAPGMTEAQIIRKLNASVARPSSCRPLTDLPGWFQCELAVNAPGYGRLVNIDYWARGKGAPSPHVGVEIPIDDSEGYSRLDRPFIDAWGAPTASDPFDVDPTGILRLPKGWIKEWKANGRTANVLFAPGGSKGMSLMIHIDDDASMKPLYQARDRGLQEAVRRDSIARANRLNPRG
jgi:hypothetical protein